MGDQASVGRYCRQYFSTVVLSPLTKGPLSLEWLKISPAQLAVGRNDAAVLRVASEGWCPQPWTSNV